MIKTVAMASVIYEDDLAEKAKLPFKHTDEDLITLAEHEVQL